MLINKIKQISFFKKITEVTIIVFSNIKELLVFLIENYQKRISPLLGKNCKHYPSCSHYAKEALQTHGILKGFILTSARLLRCNPWSLGGFDPVPNDVIFKKIGSFKIFGNYKTELYQQQEK